MMDDTALALSARETLGNFTNPLSQPIFCFSKPTGSRFLIVLSLEKP